MSKSYRTQKPSAAAARRMRIEEDGAVALPRIIERLPRRGDVHALPADVLRGALRVDVPIEYLHGLRRIELRARTGEVGEPFGCYLPDEKVIILYSIPTSWTWHHTSAAPSIVRRMKRFYAQVKRSESEVSVSWPASQVLGIWFFLEVLGHELGHHFRNQYRGRRSAPRLRIHEELVAELHANRFETALKRRVREKRRKTARPNSA
jgi:hypothetical protein